ncbi:MAG: DUF6174 domain-containing protein [Nostoc sp. DedSLP03]|uniref:DUF6174 domain-containing protein n=1 Tax=Nostoc sp. DedSLP03 TaxID=3075400 RepID=UPI002AD22669|nr:DUF6174 domain-containing protein [Nostoc sp. DedSLP03]MDZ7970617.1 DUF6174 domain-containing protein [Nostoc sp. DedSLP03]
MRLPIIISATLLLSLSMNLPAISETSAEKAQYQTQTNNSLNSRRLKFNKRLWEQANISNYSITVSNSCFCIPDARGPVVIRVRNGQPISVTSVATGQPVNPEFFQKYDTIPELFNVIQDAINRKAFNLDVEYNAKLGYPTKINIDYNSQIADEEIFLTIENFQELKTRR